MSMKILWLCVYFLFWGLGEIRANRTRTHDVQNKDELSHIDLLINGLKYEKWTQDEELCLDTMLLVLESAKNSTLWAVWMLDAMQIPHGLLYGVSIHLGNYDECLESGTILMNYRHEFLTQYCLADVVLTNNTATSRILRPEYNISTDTYLQSLTGFRRNLSILIWGTCVPRVCQQKTIPKILKVFLKNSHLGSFSEKAKITINDCQPAFQEYPTGYYVFLSVIVLLATATVCCTLLVNQTNNNAVVNNSFIAELATCLSLKRNMQSVTELKNKEIKSLNMIRLMTNFSITGGHLIFFFIVLAPNTFQFDPYVFGFVTHGNVAVDTFFMLSGLLFTREYLNDMLRNLFKYIWKRFIRLAAGFATVVLFATYVAKYIGDGPIWSKFSHTEQEVCENNLWLNLLMLGNYHLDKLCIPVLWYIPCDYQLCLLATLIFYMYNKNKNYGLYTFVVVFVIGVSLPGVLAYWNNWHPLVFSGVESAINVRENISFKYNYITAHAHIGSFMVGMVMAHILHTYKPFNHRNVISKKWSYAGILTGLWILFGVLYMGQSYLDDEGTESVRAVIFVSLSRVIWAIGICIIIGMSEYGTLPLMNDIFTWYPFAVLSRLTYGVYLVHVVLMQHMMFSIRGNYTINPLIYLVTSIGVIVYSLLVSFLLWLLVEAPIININKLLLERVFIKRKTPAKVATKLNVYHIQEKKNH